MSLILNPYSVESRTFTFVGSCQSSDSNFLNFGSLSAGAVAADDLLVYVDFTFNGGSSVSAVTPSGFTNALNTSGGAAPPYLRGMVSVKKADGTEGSITGMTGDARQKVGLVFRPSSAFTTITAAGISSQITDGNPTLQTCNPSAETTAVIVIGITAQDDGTVSFSTFSPAADGQVVNGDNDLRVGYKIFNTGPQSTSIDMDDNGDGNWLASLYLKVA